MIIKQIYTGLLLVLFFCAVIAAGLGGISESLPFWPGAMLLGVAMLVGSISFARGYHGRASKPALYAMVGFAMYIILRALVTYYSADGVAYIARQDLLFAAAAFLCYLLVTGHLEKVSHRCWVVLALLVLAGVNLYAGYVQGSGRGSYQPQLDWVKWFPELGQRLGWDGYTRVAEKREWAGLYQSENHFAGFLAMVGPLLLALGLFARGPLSWFCLLATAGVAKGAFESTSRGGSVALLIGLVAVLISWILWKRYAKGGKTNWKWVASSMAMLSVIGVVVYIGIGSLQKNYATHGVLNKDQVEGRFVHAELAWNQFLVAPIFGTGARSYEYMERSFRSLKTERWNWYTDTDMDAIFAHCDWAQLFGDYGFVGGGFAIAVLITHLIAGLQLLARTARDASPAAGLRAGLASGAIGGVLAMAALSILDFNLHIAANCCVIAILLAFLANPGRVAFEERVDAEGMPVVPRHGLLLRPVFICLGVAVSAGILIAGPDLLRADRDFFYAGNKVIEGDYFEANQYILKAEARDPQNFKNYMLAGELNYEEARKTFVSMEGKQMTPPQREFSEKVRRSFLRSAAAWYEKADLVYPRYPYAALGAGHALSKAEDFDTAEAWFQKALVHGQASRRLAMDYGTHLLMRAVKSPDLQSKLKFLDAALAQLKAASPMFRAASEDRVSMEKKIVAATKIRADVIAKMAEKAPAANATPPVAQERTPSEQPKPLVPAAKQP